MSTKKHMSERNFVHKHMVEFNKPKVYIDQKKESKKGTRKHKGQSYD